jgi:antitoxin component YwqK of YwqJK toxin-antitoxin module
MIPEIPITDTTSKIITQYANGKVSAIISLSKGLYHGKYISYYSTGSVLREEMNKYGENEGYIKTYYPNNRLRELINYSSNNRQGLYELYFESGKKQKSGNYYMDIEDGDWKIYNTDGNIKEILTYRNGIIYDIKKR